MPNINALMLGMCQDLKFAAGEIRKQTMTTLLAVPEVSNHLE